MTGAKKKSSYSAYAHDAITDVWTHTNLADREARPPVGGRGSTDKYHFLLYITRIVRRSDTYFYPVSGLSLTPVPVPPQRG